MPADLNGLVVERDVSLAPYTTLRAGGPAEFFLIAHSANELAEACLAGQRESLHVTILGQGSNVLPSDRGVRGLVILNLATRIQAARSGEVLAETGCALQDLFLKTVQAGLKGLEYAVGIPGSLGGALVSNAGAYRSSISEFLTEIEVVYEATRSWQPPEFMRFGYRDSRLRAEPDVPCAMIRVRMKLPKGDRKASYDEAREYQRQRISKQPPPASAGSFFKNVRSTELAALLPNLPESLRQSGVVPAGFLIEAAGLKGFRMGPAMFGERHANFVLNVGAANASELRALAEFGKQTVKDRFGVTLEEEVLCLGDW